MYQLIIDYILSKYISVPTFIADKNYPILQSVALAPEIWVNTTDIGDGFSGGHGQFHSGISVGSGQFHGGLGHLHSAGTGLLGGVGGFSRHQSYDVSGSGSSMPGRDPNLVA